MTMNLRPYQSQLVTDIRLQYQLGRKSVLAVLSTGGGKTYIFSYIAQQASVKGNRVLILVHRAELLDQASRSLRSMGVPHGRISAGKSMDLSHTVQVASVQTLARRLHLIPPEFFQLLIIDEAHHTNAGTWRKVIEHCASAHLLGVTATPCRTDGRGLGEWYQTMVQGPSAQWLADEGYLAAARVLAPPGFSSAGLRKKMGDYDTKEAEQRVGTIMGDIVGHYRKHLSGQTAIAFCCSVAHAEAVAGLFLSAGVAAASIDGTMSGEQRSDLLSELDVSDTITAIRRDVVNDAIDSFMGPFGFGQLTGIDIPGELEGVLPSPDWKRRRFREPEQQRWFAGETISVGIGQGYNAYTPLQLAQAVATIANGGVVYRPHLVAAIGDGEPARFG